MQKLGEGEFCVWVDDVYAKSTRILVQPCNRFGIRSLLLFVYQRPRLLTSPFRTPCKPSKYVVRLFFVIAKGSTCRKAIGTHHLEYGFPSTHSTNSVSMALFIFGQVHSAYLEYSAISSTTYWISCGVLVIYAISIVFGRIYTGMHSFTDCGMGVALGAAIWAAYVFTSDTVERWLASGSWSGKAHHYFVALAL